MAWCWYRPSLPLGELWKVGGELAIAMAPLPGEPWCGKKGTDLAHSVVYWAAVFRVAPMADSKGEAVAL